MAHQMAGEMSVPHSEATTSTKYSDQPSSYQWNLEAIIPKVVRAMSDDDQIERLGRELEFEYSEIKKFITMNQMEREVASGTKVMLRKWAKKVSVTRQQEALRDALRKAGLVQIEEKCLPNQAEAGDEQHDARFSFQPDEKPDDIFVKDLTVEYKDGGKLIESAFHEKEAREHIDCYLGGGSFGEVFKAKHPRHGEVAVRVARRGIKDQVMMDQKEFCAFTCPHIVAIKGFMQCDDDACHCGLFGIVMEFMECGSLWDFRINKWEDRPDIWPLTNRMVYQISSGMHFLHSKKIILRDLRLEKVLLDANLNAKIADLSLATNLRTSSDDKCWGTASHKPPEAFRTDLPSSAKVVTPKYDVYSFAMTLYELLTGIHPYGERGFDIMRLLKVDAKQPPALEPIPPSTPEDLKQIMIDSWSYEPDHRPDFKDIKERVNELGIEPTFELLGHFVEMCRRQIVTGNDPERIKAYEEALESGKVRCNRSRIMVVGPAGIGKTSFIRRLTGQPFNPAQKSTVGTEHNTVKKNVVSGWKLNNDTNKDEVAECMVLHEQSEEQEKPSDSSATPSDTSHSAPSDAASPSEGTKASSEDSPGKKKRKSLVQIQQEAIPSSVTEAGMPDVPQSVLERRSSSDHDSGGKQRKVIAEGMTKKRITNATSTANDISYSIWDFGGQVIYYITHPLFLSWRSLYIVVFPFHLDFNAEPPRTEEISGQTCSGPATVKVGQSNKGPRGNPRGEGRRVKSKISQIMKMLRGKRHAEQAHSEVLQIDNSSSSEQEIQGATPRTHRTILDLLHFWLMSIYVHAIPPRDRERFEPKILLVGTFRHQPGITEEDVKSKISQIKKMVQGKPYAKQVHSEILQIDNSSSSEEEVTDIQEKIDKLVNESAYMQEDLPIRWRTFSDEMRAVKRDTLLLDQARTAMTDVRIIKDIEVELVLEFYHDTGDLVYHQGCELIVLNPQILNDFVSNIITVVDDEKLEGELGDDWKILIERGILRRTLLEAVWESNKGKPNELKYLIDMMVRFDLICKIPEDPQLKTDILQGCYFVPCCSRPELGEVQKPNKDNMDDEFRFIIDFHKFLPDGFLHRLYVRMALWSMIGSKIPYKPTFHCREMLFYIDELHRVLMTNTIEGDDAHRIKVLIYRLKPKGAPEKWDKQPIRLKRDFLTYLKVSLEDLKMTWARRISYSLGMPCTNCHDKGKKFSLVSLDAFLKCEDSAHCGECDDAIHAGRVKQALLCSPARATEDSSESRKDLDIEKGLLKLSQKMPTGKYFELCNELGIGYDEANSFLVQYSNDYTRATIHCLVQWKVNENDCLSKLKTILPKIEVGDLVKYIE